METSNKEQMLTMKQVAHYMNVSSRTVMRWLETGWLRGTRIGGVIRVHPNDLSDLIDQKTITPTKAEEVGSSR